jgi:hypothetical protein
MFDSLEKQIERSEGSPPTSRERVFRYLGLLAITLVVFIALFMAVRMVG